MRGRERAAGEHRVHAARLPWLHGGCPHSQPRLSIAAIPHSLPTTPSFQHPPPSTPGLFAQLKMFWALSVFALLPLFVLLAFRRQ